MGKAWVKARKRDPYYRAAKAQDLRSRAAFKLVQIQERFGLIYPGDVIVDLGASPGGWSRAAAEMVGPTGRGVAVDRVRMGPLDRVTIVRGDFTDPNVQTAVLEALGRPADVVLSDAAPRFSGTRSVDLARALAPGPGARALRVREGLRPSRNVPGILRDVRRRDREARLRPHAPSAFARSRHRSASSRSPSRASTSPRFSHAATYFGFSSTARSWHARASSNRPSRASAAPWLFHVIVCPVAILISWWIALSALSRRPPR